LRSADIEYQSTKPIRCTECGRPMAMSTADRLYTTGGLENVRLMDISVLSCPENHESLHIPDLDSLHARISESIVLKPTALSGAELRFLRKRLRMTARAFAKPMGVTEVHISRWETGASPLSATADRLARLLFVQVSREQGLCKTMFRLLDLLSEITRSQTSDAYEHRLRLMRVDLPTDRPVFEWRIERGERVEVALPIASPPEQDWGKLRAAVLSTDRLVSRELELLQLAAKSWGEVAEKRGLYAESNAGQLGRIEEHVKRFLSSSMAPLLHIGTTPAEKPQERSVERSDESAARGPVRQ
jgi:DNA-binding transcriptional regulator YiaG